MTCGFVELLTQLQPSVQKQPRELLSMAKQEKPKVEGSTQAIVPDFFLDLYSFVVRKS